MNTGILGLKDSFDHVLNGICSTSKEMTKSCSISVLKHESMDLTG